MKTMHEIAGAMRSGAELTDEDLQAIADYLGWNFEEPRSLERDVCRMEGHDE